MSAMAVHSVPNVNGINIGPEMNGPLRLLSHWIPAHRITRLEGNFGDVAVKLAARNKPENDGALLVRIGTNDRDFFTVEFCQKVNYDEEFHATPC